jgi:hypothetical protein
MFRDKELDAHHKRRLNAFVGDFENTIKNEAVHPATRLKELDRIYRELEKVCDERVSVLDKLQGNGDRGPRGEYYFPTVQHAVNGIRNMRNKIIDINQEIALEEIRIKRRTYNQFVEDEINDICSSYKIEGLKTL